MIPARGEQGFQIVPNGKKPTMRGLGNLVDSAMGNKQNFFCFISTCILKDSCQEFSRARQRTFP